MNAGGLLSYPLARKSRIAAQRSAAQRALQPPDDGRARGQCGILRAARRRSLQGAFERRAHPQRRRPWRPVGAPVLLAHCRSWRGRSASRPQAAAQSTNSSPPRPALQGYQSLAKWGGLKCPGTSPPLGVRGFESRPLHHFSVCRGAGSGRAAPGAHTAMPRPRLLPRPAFACAHSCSGTCLS